MRGSKGSTGAIGLVCLLVAACGDVVVNGTEDAASDISGDTSVDSGPDVTGPCKSDQDCDTGLTCRIGTCDLVSGKCNVVTADDACFIDDVCFASGQEQPGERCKECNPNLTQTGFVSKQCPADQTCNPSTGLCAIAQPKAFGEDCTEDFECSSGLCVDEPGGGKVCTQSCTGPCPEGFGCTDVEIEGNKILVCLSKTLLLCSPCEADADCTAAGATQGARCLDAGPDGSFCGIACSSAADCPGGYDCAAPDGGSNQCVPTGGQCSCTGYAIDAGATTSCGEGACAGSRSCEASGLTACIPDVPGTDEVCDGNDNDCDGETDEDFKDADGLYVDDEHCGQCGDSCDGVIPDAFAECAVVDGNATCVLATCKPGFEESSPGVCTKIPAKVGACGVCTSDAECQPNLACVDLGGTSHCVAPCTPGDGTCPAVAECATVVGGGTYCVIPALGCPVEGSECTGDAECDDLNPCTIGSCVDGGCAIVPASEGTACDDGDLCTDGDACAAGGCSGVPDTCDDGNECTDDSCYEVTGECINAPTDGGSCDDGDTCTTDDVCVSGTCEGTPGGCDCVVDTDCAVDPANADCVSATCDAGMCVYADVNDGGGCDDGDGCSVGDTCDAGICVAGTPLDCSSLDDECVEGVCVAGQCEAQALPCGVTSVMLHTPSVAASLPYDTQLGMCMSAGHGQPVGPAAGGTFSVRLGFLPAAIGP